MIKRIGVSGQLWTGTLTLILCVSLLAACQQEASVEKVAVLVTTKGNVTVELFKEDAPAHVENFLQLCGSGFYNGTYFHRVAPGFLIQGGDPNTTDKDRDNDGLGGYPASGLGTELVSELNEMAHTRGTISMARTSASNSAGSQFFILLAEDESLNRDHTVFGKVIDGIEVVAQIAEEPGIPHPAGGTNPLVHQFLEECRIEPKN